MRPSLAAALLAAAFVAACGAEPDAKPAAGAEVSAIAEAAWEELIEKNTYLRFKHGLPVRELQDVTYEQAERDAAFARSLVERIDAVDRDGLSHEDGLTLDILRWQAVATVEGTRFYWLPFGVTPYSGGFMLTLVHQVFAGHSLQTEQDRDRYLHLLDEYVDLVDQMREKVQGQERLEILIPKPEIPAVVGMFEAYRDGAEGIFGVTPERLPSSDEAVREAFTKSVDEKVKGALVPAYEKLLETLGPDYVGRAPEAVGLAQYGQGSDYYRYLVRLHTTLDLTPEQVHETGLATVAELLAEMKAIRDELGFAGTQQEFHAQLRRDSRFLATTPEEVEARYLEYVGRMEPKIGELFEVLPKAPYGVERLDPASEAGMTFGYYEPPTKDKPVGNYRYNGSQLASRPLVTAGPLIYHELIPGHHFHLARQQENENLPVVRRELMAVGAFNEGWGNYAAGLAREYGLLDDPYDRYGWALFDVFVATRLVVDTGMNHMGWSRERAIAYMWENTFSTETEIATETLRYAVDMPGQALAYRTGFAKIRELRDKVKAALGAEFDIRDFHEAVLGSGAMPLSILESHIDWFIEQRRSATSPRS